MHETVVKIPKIFKPLLSEHKRIKFCYGGRAGGKSYAFADSLLLLARMKPLFIVCLREIQGSIKDSVHKLLADRISYYGFHDYKVSQNKIENILTGSSFIFKGLRDQDPQKIKSLEGADIAWIEEAQTISKKSWDILEPTIRKQGSEIWISMNREEENDPLWVALACTPDENTWVQKVNFYDNPFCPQEMLDLAQKVKESNPQDYAHIWLGEPVQTGDKKLISYHLVQEAMRDKEVLTKNTAPLIIGLDIARFGDDETVFCFRRGRVCEKFITLKKQDTIAVANRAIHFIETEKPMRLFLDVGGVGGGVYDILRDRGYERVVRAVNFGNRAFNEKRYGNMRVQMWDKIRAWLADPMPVFLPPEERLKDDLTSVNKKYDAYGRLLLESKEAIKKRLGRSPDLADALALTFAQNTSLEDSAPYKEGMVQDINACPIEAFFERQNNHFNEW